MADVTGDKMAFDRELEALEPVARQAEWVRRIEAVLFASATPVSARDLSRVVGQGADVEALVAVLAEALAERPYEVVRVGDGWVLRTRVEYGAVIRKAANVGDQLVGLSEFEVAVLATIAYHQPVTRDGLRDVFGKEVSRDLIGRLHDRRLIATGPRSPRRGAPYTYVTTETFLTVFGLESLRDLPDREMLEDAGILAREGF